MNKNKEIFKLFCDKKNNINHSKERDVVNKIEQKLKTKQNFVDSSNQSENQKIMRQRPN
jgi:hypothetical protein